MDCNYPNCFECVLKDCDKNFVTVDERKHQQELDTVARHDLKNYNDSQRKRIASQKKYSSTDKGKERNKRYAQSDKGRETHKHYEESDKGKERLNRYDQSDKGKERHRKYRNSDKGRENNKQACRRYYYKQKLLKQQREAKNADLFSQTE